MFGNIGPTELILIFIIALVVFGPKKLPEIGKSVGKAIREFKKASEEIKGRIEEEIQASELDTLQSGVRGFQDRLKQTMGFDDSAKPPTAIETASAVVAPYYASPETHSGAENPVPGPESSSSGPDSDPYASLEGKETRHNITPEPGSLQDDIKKDKTEQ